MYYRPDLPRAHESCEPRGRLEDPEVGEIAVHPQSVSMTAALVQLERAIRAHALHSEINRRRRPRIAGVIQRLRGETRLSPVFHLRKTARIASTFKRSARTRSTESGW